MLDSLGIAGAPESGLAPDVAARLPPDAPPAPWTAQLRAAVWMHPATDAAAAQLPGPLRGRRRTLPLTIGAAIHYSDTPVGGYGEVLASPVLLAEWPLPAAVVAFIAVDSLASIAGGRVNWALPKTLARFEWSAPFAMHAEGDGAEVPWSVDVVTTTRPRELPLRLGFRTRQAFPDGRARAVPVVLSGRAQLATIGVESRGPTLPGWLVAGRHPGLVLTNASARFDVPR